MPCHPPLFSQCHMPCQWRPGGRESALSRAPSSCCASGHWWNHRMIHFEKIADVMGFSWESLWISCWLDLGFLEVDFWKRSNMRIKTSKRTWKKNIMGSLGKKHNGNEMEISWEYFTLFLTTAYGVPSKIEWCLTTVTLSGVVDLENDGFYRKTMGI